MALKAGRVGVRNDQVDINGKIVAAGGPIKTVGNGLRVDGAGELDLQPASTEALGGVIVGDGLEIDSDGVLSASGGGVNYSTEEQDTGLKWIDGTPIYQKTFTGTSPSGVNYVDLDTTIESDKIVGIEGFAKKDGANGYNIPFITGTVELYVRGGISNGVTLNTGSGYRSAAYVVTIKYHK